VCVCACDSQTDRELQLHHTQSLALLKHNSQCAPSSGW